MQWIAEHVAHQGDECLIWPFCRSQTTGYGKLQVDGKHTNGHRVICERAHGPAPTKKHQAAHSCGRGHEGCVNPKHLRWATCRENLADRIEHGTLPQGECHGQSKLHDRDIPEIVARRNQGESLRSIGDHFGVDFSTVWKIVHGKNWGHVSGLAAA